MPLLFSLDTSLLFFFSFIFVLNIKPYIGCEDGGEEEGEEERENGRHRSRPVNGPCPHTHICILRVEKKTMTYEKRKKNWLPHSCSLCFRRASSERNVILFEHTARDYLTNRMFSRSYTCFLAGLLAFHHLGQTVSQTDRHISANSICCRRSQNDASSTSPVLFLSAFFCVRCTYRSWTLTICYNA